MANFFNNQTHKLYHECIGEGCAMLWGMIGTLAFTGSPACFFTGKNHVSYDTLMLTTFAFLLLGGSTFIAVYFLRQTAAMRIRRGWAGAATLNSVVSIIVTAVTVTRQPTMWHVYGLICVAVTALALGEVAKPVFDFGLVQAFLRMPLQTALVCRYALNNGEVGPVTIVAAIVVLLFGNLWQTYFAVGEKWPVGGNDEETTE